MKPIIKHCTSCCLALAMATALLATLASCSKEEATDDTLPPGKYPITFTATMQGLTVQKAASRATTVNIWDGNEEVAVKIDSKVKKYTAAADGKLTVAADGTTFYWTNNTMSVEAWHSATYSNTKPTSFTVQPDQSSSGYQSSDMLYASRSIIFNGNNPASLTFRHLPAKVVVNLKNGEGVTADEVKDAAVTIENQATTSGAITYAPNTGMASVEQATPGSTSITPNALTSTAWGVQKSVQVLLVPQQMQGRQFIKVTINNNDYYYTPTGNDANLQAGKQYTYTITVKKNELVVTVKDNGATWTDSELGSGPAQTAILHIRGGDGMTLAAGDGGTLTDKSGYKELSGTNLLKVTVAKQTGKFLKGISIGGISVLQSWKSDGTNYEIIYQLKGDVTLTNQDYEDKPALAVGSYYYADGEWSTELWNKPCIGIVFKVGKDDSDDGSYTDMNGTAMSTINGYVVALEDANSGTLQWANKDGNYSVDVGTSTNKSDWKGYSNSQTIKSYTTNDWSIKYFPAANACLNFGTTFPKYAAPGSSSGWFLPSCGQLKSLYDNGNTLSGKIDNLKRGSEYEDIKWFIGNWYWSSTEYDNSWADYAWGVAFNGYVDRFDKNVDYRVRSIFAF